MAKVYAIETTKTQRQYLWKIVSESEYRCGDVRLKLGLDHRGVHNWHYEVLVGRRWRKAYLNSRPWGYGDRGRPSAFVGFSKIKEFIYV